MYISEDDLKNSSDKLDKILQETKEILEREKKKKQSKSNNSNSSNDNSYVMNAFKPALIDLNTFKARANIIPICSECYKKINKNKFKNEERW